MWKHRYSQGIGYVPFIFYILRIQITKKVISCSEILSLRENRTNHIYCRILLHVANGKLCRIHISIGCIQSYSCFFNLFRPRNMANFMDEKFFTNINYLTMHYPKLNL